VTMQDTGNQAPPDEIATARAPDWPERRCTRCGAVGTHYLTCSRLRLPSGYQLSEDPDTHAAGQALPAVSRRSSSGPDHPDWPRPPQH
jgi:hypothetical protein